MSSAGPTRRPWTTGEQKKLDEFLKAGKTGPEIATALQRTPQSIYSQLHRLDIKRKKAARRMVQIGSEGEEMSVLRARPWTSHEDIVLQRLAAAGKYLAAIATEMTRSEAAIRTHAALLNLTLAKGQRGPKAKE
jgi:hypothetical protein